MPLINAALAVTIAYLLGSIPTGYLITRWARGVDITEMGDGSTGATNVSRVAGRAAGIATAVGDVAKGAAAMLLARVLPMPEAASIIVALAVASGHIWPIFLRFRGGAGLATAVGVILMALPVESLILLGPFAALALTFGRRHGLGATSALLLGPLLVLSWWLGEPPHLIALPVVLGAFLGIRLYWQHRNE